MAKYDCFLNIHKMGMGSFYLIGIMRIKDTEGKRLECVKACVSCALVAQLCPTLCDPMDYSPPDSSVHGISQARILEWVPMSSSRGSSQPGDQTHISYVSHIYN